MGGRGEEQGEDESGGHSSHARRILFQGAAANRAAIECLSFASPGGPMADLKITPRKDGPLKVEGDNITLVDETGNRYDLQGRTVVSLCRCGQSQNKPFCDGSHVKVGFAAESAAFQLPPPKPRP